MRPLTFVTPKPMIRVLGKPLIEHIVARLPDAVDELLIVVGYKGEQIVEYCGDVFLGRKVRYFWQEKPEGTAKALELTRAHLRGKFMVMYCDDLHGAEDLKALIRYDLSLLVYRHEHPERFGVVSKNKRGVVTSLVEKPDHPQSNLVSTGPVVLDERIFDYEPVVEKGEAFLATQIGNLVKDYPVHAVEQKLWIPVGYPEDLAILERALAPAPARKWEPQPVSGVFRSA